MKLKDILSKIQPFEVEHDEPTGEILLNNGWYLNFDLKLDTYLETDVTFSPVERHLTDHEFIALELWDENAEIVELGKASTESIKKEIIDSINFVTY